MAGVVVLYGGNHVLLVLVFEVGGVLVEVGGVLVEGGVIGDPDGNTTTDNIKVSYVKH